MNLTTGLIRRRKIPYATPSRSRRIDCHSGFVPRQNLLFDRTGSRAWRWGGATISCIDAKTGKVLWKNTEIGRTISTPSVADGLVYQAEYLWHSSLPGCRTGEVYWTYDSYSRIWGSTLLVDGRVLLGNEDGDLLIFAHGKEFSEPEAINLGAPIYSSPVVANKTLYISTQTHLYAVGK